MTEIRETDDTLFADAHDLPNEYIRCINLLQGLAQDDIIKALFRIIRNLCIDVSLKNRQPFLNAGGDLVFFEFNTGAGHLFFVD